MMAILLKNKDLADNHTFTDLLNSIRPYVSVPADLEEDILSCEQVQSICNLYEYHREPPSQQVVDKLEKAATRIYSLAEQVCMAL